MRTLAVSLLMMFVAGCATQSERAAQVQRDVDDMIKGLRVRDAKNWATRPIPTSWRDCVNQAGGQRQS